jgi:chorismate mutase/prephenate dehydratase
MREDGGGGGGPAPGIEALRREIEALDDRLVELVDRRVALARRIGDLKREARGATLDPEREAAVIRRAVESARSRGLPTEPVRELFWTLLGLCRSRQIEDR